MEFPGVLVFGLGISKGDDFQGRCYTVLHNFQGWSFDLSRISRGKVNKRKTPGGGSKQCFLLMLLKGTFVIYGYLMSDGKL